MIKKLLARFLRKEPTAYRMMSQEEFDAKFYAEVKPFRESAEKAGCDMAAFDMEIAVRKARVDEFRANAQHFYQQRPSTQNDGRKYD